MHVNKLSKVALDSAAAETEQV